MVLATKKNCQRVLAASFRVVSAMTGNPPLPGDAVITINNSTIVLFSVPPQNCLADEHKKQ